MACVRTEHCPRYVYMYIYIYTYVCMVDSGSYLVQVLQNTLFGLSTEEMLCKCYTHIPSQMLNTRNADLGSANFCPSVVLNGY